MALTDQEQIRANDLAIEIALTELVRFVLSEMCYSDDENEFRRRINAAEKAMVNSLSSRTLWTNAKPEDESYIREAASAFITRLLSSVRHPSELQQK